MSDLMVCVAGKNNIGVEVLEYLYENCNGRYQLCVVCNKTETGENGCQRSLRLRAQQLGIKEYKLADLYEMENLIFLSMEFDQIVRTGRFKTDRLYNIHFSLLPAYKGMYTSALPILNSEKTVGVTLHRIDDGIDTGEIIDQKPFELKPSYTCRDLYFAYIENGIELVLKNIEVILRHEEVSTPQKTEYSTYFSRSAIDYSNLTIDLNQTAWGIRSQIRAFSFREHQMPDCMGHDIFEVQITDSRSDKRAGTVIAENEHAMRIATVDYDVILHYDRFQELLNACRTGEIEKVKEICKVSDRYISEVSKEGWTPLIVAAYHNQTACVDYLLEQGADCFAKGKNGTNLLMYAKDAFWKTGDSTLMERFLELQLSPLMEDYFGNNLYFYVDRNDVDEGLKQKLREILLRANR